MKRQTPKYNSLYEYVKSEEKGKELFDLKEQFNEELWCQQHSIVNHGSAVANFLAYKGLPEFCDFDCDGTVGDDYYKQGYCSWLMREIYRTLWNWQDYCQSDEDKFMNMPIKRFAESCYGDMQMGPETMNSFWITFSRYLTSFFNETYKWRNTFLFRYGENGSQEKRALRLMQDIESGRENRIDNENIMTFAHMTHTIGNMLLVPAGYNGYRGTKSYLKDYFDLSLDNLVNSWDGNSYLGTEDKDRQQKFKKYINTFFLYDYVNKVDETYQVLPLCESHGQKLMMKEKQNSQYVLPEKSEIDHLCSEINNCIKRRGLFMAAMLKIALGRNYDGKSEYEYQGIYQEEWEKWNVTGIYKRFMEEIFLKEEVYAGYGDVIGRMKTVAEEMSEKAWINTILDDLRTL